MKCVFICERMVHLVPITKAPIVPDMGSWLMGLRSVLPQAGLPTRQVRKKIKVDTSKFMTPYLAHSQKMLEQFSHVGNISALVFCFCFLKSWQ